MKDRVEAALADLRGSIKRMKELMEWQKLKSQEKKSRMPPSFRIEDPLEADIKIEEGFFLKTAWDLRSFLADGSDPPSKRQRERLVKLEEEMRELSRRE